MLKRIGAEESGQFKAVASGALSSGRPVVVNANGTVSTISGSPAAFGAQQEFEDAATENLSGTYDTTNDRIVFAYPDSGHSGNGKVVAGTVDSSNNTISFGTPVRVNSAFTGISSISVDFDTSNGKLLIVYVGNSKIYAKVGTVSSSDNSISLGSRVEIDSGSVNMGPGACKYDPDTGKFLLVYNIDGGDSKGVVGTISGTSVSFGTKTTWESSANTSQHQMVYDTGSNKFVVAFLYGGASLRCRVATISGTSVSFSNATFIKNGNTSKHFGLAYDSTNNKIVAAYSDPTNSNYGTAAIGTVTTTCDFSGETVFESATSQQVDAAFNPTTGAVDIAYKDNGNSQKGTFINATISSGSLTFTTAEAFTTGEANDFHLVYDPDSTKMIIGLRDHTTSQNGVAVVRQISTLNLTSENYIGMSSGVAFQTGSAASKGSATVFESASIDGLQGVYDPDSQKVILGYRDSGNSSFGTAVVGTVSGTSISFGTPVVFESANCNHVSLTYDTNLDKVVIAYNDEGNSRFGTAIVGTVSGTSISFGSAAVYESARSDNVRAAFDSNNNKVVIAYQDDGNSSHGTAVVATVSGTSISFGTPVVFEAAETDGISIVYDTNAQKIVIAYRDAGDSNQGRAIVGTVSGTSISFGTAVEFTSNNSLPISAVYESDAQKIVIAFNDFVNTKGKAIVGTVSGTSISFGTEVTFENSYGDYLGITYDSSVGKVVIGYQDDNNSNTGTIISGKVSGTSISFDDPFVVAGEVKEVIPIYDANSSKVVIAYRDVDSSNHGTAVVTTTNTIATTRSELASGNQASVDIIGSVSDNQIGLTAGQQYYVQTDGTIGTTADSPSVLAGTAISATELLVKT